MPQLFLACHHEQISNVTSAGSREGQDRFQRGTTLRSYSNAQGTWDRQENVHGGATVSGHAGRNPNRAFLFLPTVRLAQLTPSPSAIAASFPSQLTALSPDPPTTA